jgi:hypothetical protein
MTTGRSIPYNTNRHTTNWISPTSRKLAKRTFKAKNGSSIHATIYSATDAMFFKYAKEWVKRMRLRHPKETVLDPVNVGSLKGFLAFMEKHKSNRFITLSFFGHGYAGGFLFEGKESDFINALDASMLSARIKFTEPRSGHHKEALKLLFRPLPKEEGDDEDNGFDIPETHKEQQHPPEDTNKLALYKHCFTTDSHIYLFACRTSNSTTLVELDGSSVIVFSISIVLSNFFGCHTTSAADVVHYLQEGFGFATLPVEGRTDPNFVAFKFDHISSGANLGADPADYFGNAP